MWVSKAYEAILNDTPETRQRFSDIIDSLIFRLLRGTGKCDMASMPLHPTLRRSKQIQLSSAVRLVSIISIAFLTWSITRPSFASHLRHCLP